jgi:hypothetical protein
LVLDGNRDGQHGHDGAKPSRKRRS